MTTSGYDLGGISTNYGRFLEILVKTLIINLLVTIFIVPVAMYTHLVFALLLPLVPLCYRIAFSWEDNKKIVYDWSTVLVITAFSVILTSTVVTLFALVLQGSGFVLTKTIGMLIAMNVETMVFHYVAGSYSLWKGNLFNLFDKRN